MIQIEIDYEPVIYEQPIESYYFQNYDYFPLNYFERPINHNEIIVDIVEELTEEKPTEGSSTNHIYQYIYKKTQLPK